MEKVNELGGGANYRSERASQSVARHPFWQEGKVEHYE